jgi:hypothetical protein
MKDFDPPPPIPWTTEEDQWLLNAIATLPRSNKGEILWAHLPIPLERTKSGCQKRYFTLRAAALTPPPHPGPPRKTLN